MFRKFKNAGRRFHPLKILFFVMVFAVFVLALGWVVMFLWNAILPDAVGAKPLTFWKAVGLLLLAKILFGGFGRNSRRGPWKSKWKDKWMNMSDEEREQMKTKWKERCSRRNKENKE